MSRFQMEAVVLGLEPSLVCCVCCFKILCVVGLPPGGCGGGNQGRNGEGACDFSWYRPPRLHSGGVATGI